MGFFFKNLLLNLNNIVRAEKYLGIEFLFFFRNFFENYKNFNLLCQSVLTNCIYISSVLNVSVGTHPQENSLNSFFF